MVQPKNSTPPHDRIGDLLREIADVIAAKTGHDFSQYKTSTLARRVHRRMQMLGEDEPDAYLERLRQDADEQQALFEEMLIGVTHFFRNPTSFESLAKDVVAPLLEARAAADGDEGEVRIWVPGCSSGEELYSIAMLVAEQADRIDQAPRVKLFGTDIDTRALQTARKGRYGADIVEHVGEERLQRFFTKRGEHYQVNAYLREMCLFSSHSLVGDPPFLQLDLISCRNLLIYFDAALQEKIIALFHYALADDGYLFLGNSETLTSYAEFFEEIDAKHRTWRRKDTGARRPHPVHVPITSHGTHRQPKLRSEHSLDVERRMERALVRHHAPPAAVVDAEGRIVCTSEGIGRYLEVSGGCFQNNIIQMARSGLRVALRAALNRIKRSNDRIVHPNLSVQTADGVQPVRLVVEPLSEAEPEDFELYLLVFSAEAASSSETLSSHADLDQETESLIEQLEGELRSTRGDLERTVQELEASNEELKSSNEELLSMNEELQTANEELEVSNDEVESTNRALAQAKADLENLLESTHIATLFLDGEGRIQRFTPAVTNIYNVRPRDVGRPLEEITHCVDQIPALPAPDDLDDDGEPLEHELCTDDGRRFLRRIHPYRDEDGPTGDMVVSFVEVTDIKEAQEQLEAQAKELECSQAQLEQSIRRAEAANRSKSEFLANMSHEIRTPMTAILGYADILLGHLDDPDDRQCVDTIIRNGRFLLDIINDILDLSKIEAGKLEVDRSLVAPDKLVAEVASLMYVRAEDKGLPLEIEFDGKLPETIETDPRRLRQILVNLVGNALKFTDDGRVCVRTSFDEADHQLYLEVIDTGIGMSETQQQKLFEPFTQADTSRTRNYDGTGLGLTICARLAGALGGTIEVDSAPGRGSTFRLIVPTGDIGDVALVEPQRGIVSSNRAPRARAEDLSSHVLVVDDRHEIRYLARHFIEEAGGTTECAENGRVALRRIAQADRDGQPFDLVVMDMQMPVMDGFEATRRLRESGYDRPILALTAAAMQEDRHQCLEAGCDDHLAKPIEATELLAAVATYCDGPVDAGDDDSGEDDSDDTEATVLLVEDNRDTREALSKLLELHGIPLISCADGRTAVELAREHRPEAIVLDLGLPDMSGYEVCKKLRECEALDDSLLIALSGRNSIEDVQRSQEVGFDHHIAKPPRTGELLGLLEDCI
ncbi:MAG: CheR family methyltransferase [Persicimonas sp.]